MTTSNLQFNQLNKFGQFCIKYNLRWVLYIVWFILSPMYVANYAEQAADDALRELEQLKKAKYE